MQLRRLVLVPSLLLAVTVVWSAVALMLVGATVSPTGDPVAVARTVLPETRTKQVTEDLETVDVAFDGAGANLGDPKASR